MIEIPYKLIETLHLLTLAEFISNNSDAMVLCALAVLVWMKWIVSKPGCIWNELSKGNQGDLKVIKPQNLLSLSPPIQLPLPHPIPLFFLLTESFSFFIHQSITQPIFKYPTPMATPHPFLPPLFFPLQIPSHHFFSCISATNVHSSISLPPLSLEFFFPLYYIASHPPNQSMLPINAPALLPLACLPILYHYFFPPLYSLSLTK